MALAICAFVLFGCACTPTRYVDIKVGGTSPGSDHYECKRAKEDEPLTCTKVGATTWYEHDNTVQVPVPERCNPNRVRVEGAETDAPTVRVICAQVGN
jgi:hypothetical protein